MSWLITGSEKYETDAYRSQVSLLLHGDGANGSTTIVDSSPSPKTVTAFGNAQISTAIADPFGNSTGVLAFDGTGDYLSVSDTSVFNVGTGDFTIEWWQKLATTNTSYTQFKFNSTGGVKASNSSIQLFSPVQSLNVAGTASFTTDWEHIAVVRSSAAVKLFHKGTLIANNLANIGTGSAIIPDRIEIGNPFTPYVSMNGYIDDLRITKGVARYTSNFTPPTAPFPNN